MKIRIITSVLIAFCSVSLIAQEQGQRLKPLEEFTIMNLSYTTYGETEFKENAQIGEVAFTEFRLALAFPKLLKNKKTVLINGLEFTNLKPEFSSETPNSSPITKNFYSIAYRFGVINPLGSNGWSYSLGLKPTIASDFEESVSSEDFILQASVLFSKRANQNFKYGFGLTYSTRFGKKQVLPVVQLVYKRNNWGTYAYLPAYIAQFYHFNTSKLGLSIRLNGNNYNFMSTANVAGLDLDKLSFSRVNIGPEYELKLTKSLRLNLNGGITVASKLDWLNGDGNSELDLSPENKFFAKIGLKLMR